MPEFAASPLSARSTTRRSADHDDVVKQRIMGVLIGAACADALGAPFEFGTPGDWSDRFPAPVLGGTGEMIGGGGFGWAPGEFTDDTQMGLLLAESILATGGIDLDDLWVRWTRWARSANDVGIITRSTLSRPTREGAAEAAHRDVGRSASNGALMRVFPIGIAFLGLEGEAATRATMQAAVAQAAITHHDPAAGWGAAIAAELIRRAVLAPAYPGVRPDSTAVDALAELDDIIAHVPEPVRERFATMLAPDWQPNQPGDPSNGSVWGCLAQAVWALRHHHGYHDVVTAAIDLGGDTDTVACVAGAIAGAAYSIQGIPGRWLTYVHGHVDREAVESSTGATRHGLDELLASDPQSSMVRYSGVELQNMARLLAGLSVKPDTPAEYAAGPQRLEVQRNGAAVQLDVHAADLKGTIDAAAADPTFAVLSLCRVNEWLDHVPVRRAYYLRDEEGLENADLAGVITDAVDTIDAWLAEGRKVIVHCHGGRSRTTVVLRAWAMRHLGLDADEAYRWMEQWHRFAPYNQTFNALLDGHWTDHCAQVGR